MYEQPSTKTQPLVALYVIPHLRWEREWHDTFETRRAALLDILSEVLKRLENKVDVSARERLAPLETFLLSGQTVLLEDIAAIRPDLLALLVIYNAAGRLDIGPWYIAVDDALVSGESLVRNLLTARADARKHGIKLLPIGYMPDYGGHSAQLPQILRGFDIDSAFIRSGGPVLMLPFRWEAPDGSSVLAIHHDNPQYGVPDPRDYGYPPKQALNLNVQRQDAITPTGPYLWVHALHDADVDDFLRALAQIREDCEVAVIQNTLPTYVNAMRRSLPDKMRPTLLGEQRVQTMREGSYVFPGTLSTRIHLKQANAHLQNLYTHAVDPWTAVALTHGRVQYPLNLRELLDYGWRLVLKNQSMHALAGTGGDSTHVENEVRYQQAVAVGAHLVNNALAALSGKPFVPQPQTAPAASVITDTVGRQKTFVAVWNPHNWEAEQVVEVPLHLPPGIFPLKLLDPDGKEETFGWQETPDAAQPSRHIGVLSFFAHTPPVGFACYELRLAPRHPGEHHRVESSKGHEIISMPTPTTLTVQGNKLVWRKLEPPVTDASGAVVQPEREAWRIDDLLRFFDGGDAGDTYNYSPPEPDLVVQAELLNTITVEQSPLYQRLKLSHRLRIPPELQPDRTRRRGLKVLEINTTATFYDYMPGVYFRTTFTNTAKDHRLRAHLRTTLNSETVLADAPFGLQARNALGDGPLLPPNNRPYLEGIINTLPLQSVCAVTSDNHPALRGVALLSRGLPEFEALLEQGQTTLALTLLRAVGWLSRGDLRARTAAVAPLLAVPGAQLYEREITADYALLPLLADGAAADNPLLLLRAGRGYSAPLQAYQYSSPPKLRRHSFLRLEGDPVLLAALKPPVRGMGWIVRFFNPTDKPADVKLVAHVKPSAAYRVSLAEDQQQELTLESDGSVRLQAAPQQIVTVRVEFG